MKMTRTLNRESKGKVRVSSKTVSTSRATAGKAVRKAKEAVSASSAHSKQSVAGKKLAGNDLIGKELNANSTVEVLYQKMGDRWFAFSLVGDEIFVGSISSDEILGKDQANETTSPNPTVKNSGAPLNEPVSPEYSSNPEIGLS